MLVSSLSHISPTNGISHRIYCPHTSSQNGLAERKIHHLVEMAHTLLIHRSMPSSFFIDDIFTSAYLINRVPLSILLFKFSFEYIFGIVSNYSLTCVLGCLLPFKFSS